MIIVRGEEGCGEVYEDELTAMKLSFITPDAKLEGRVRFGNSRADLYYGVLVNSGIRE